MATPPKQVSQVTEASPGLTSGKMEETTKSPDFQETTPTAVTTSNGEEEGEHHHDLSRLERIQTNFGDRPECFKNTFQEISFVFQATVATATTSFLMGVGMIITVPVSRDLGMTQGEIAWISASTSYV